ncbi:probable G-protein coupled receptor Mth-like 6 [Drosophila takahashii]|uniref:probable G-protein coupled receptor Mth-like 6 n=1 Tax=Drosophila takahashii TaxID=29030 RepID=UPI00389931A3
MEEMGKTFHDHIILRDYACEDLNIRGYTWIENEHFLVQSFNWTEKVEYKIYRYSSKLLPPAVREIGLISLICYILTIAVYLYVNKLQNLGGKCFICCLFCMFMKCLFWVLNSWKLLKGVHFLAGYMTFFFWMASFLWFFALNHVFWERFGFDKSKPARFRFRTYSFFVWDSAAMLTVLIYTLNYFWGINPRYMCQYSIWLKEGNVSIFYGIYYGLMLTVSLLNMMFTILTVRILRKQIRDLKKSNPVMEIMTYVMWLRLSTILGVTWSLDLFLSVLQTYHFWPQVLRFADYFHAAFGITIFVLFVLKRSTLQWLKEGNRVNMTQKHPDAHMAETSC